MKPMHTNGGRGAGRKGGGREVALILAGLTLLGAGMLRGQETNPPPRPDGGQPAVELTVTNTLAETNLPALAPMPADTNAPPDASTNASTLAATNAAPDAGEAPALAPTNFPATNETVSPPPAAEPAPAAGSRGPSRLDYASLRMIADRNIFNPNRSSRSGRSERREFRRPIQVDSFSLVGTMGYEKGFFAFFDGSSLQYRKALKVDDTIAGYRLLQVGHDWVKLAAGSNTMDLKIGQQMRREDEGPWHVSARGESFAAAAPAAPRPPASETSAASPPTGAEGAASVSASELPAAAAPASTAASSEPDDDVLKRLMQRREQEMNK